MRQDIENFLINNGFVERATPYGKDTEWFKKESFYEIIVYRGVVLFHFKQELYCDALSLDQLTEKCFTLKNKLDDLEING